MVVFNREAFINRNDHLVGGREVRMRDRLCLNCNPVHKVYWSLIDFTALIYLFADTAIESPLATTALSVTNQLIVHTHFKYVYIQLYILDFTERVINSAVASIHT